MPYESGSLCPRLLAAEGATVIGCHQVQLRSNTEAITQHQQWPSSELLFILFLFISRWSRQDSECIFGFISWAKGLNDVRIQHKRRVHSGWSPGLPSTSEEKRKCKPQIPVLGFTPKSAFWGGVLHSAQPWRKNKEPHCLPLGPIYPLRRVAGLPTTDHGALTGAPCSGVGAGICLTNHFSSWVILMVQRESPCKSLGDRGCCPSPVYGLSLLGHSTTLEMTPSWITSMVSGGYRPGARDGRLWNVHKGGYGHFLPYSNEANKMVLETCSTCFEEEGRLSSIPFKESSAVCLVTNVSWKMP